jgi:hypothetical protein
MLIGALKDILEARRPRASAGPHLIFALTYAESGAGRAYDENGRQLHWLDAGCDMGATDHEMREFLESEWPGDGGKVGLGPPDSQACAHTLDQFHRLFDRPPRDS